VWVAAAHNVTAAYRRPGGVVRGELVVCCYITAGAVPDNQVTCRVYIDTDTVTDNVIGLDTICAASGADASRISRADYTHAVTFTSIADHIASARDCYPVTGISASGAVSDRAAGACLDSTAAIADHGTLVKIAAAVDDNAGATVVTGCSTICVHVGHHSES